MKKFIIPIILIIALVTIALSLYINKDEFINESKQITLQIIEDDIVDNSEEVVKEIQIKANDFIELPEKYDGNDIKIIEITNDYVKISREKIRYNIISQVNMYNGEYEKYTETVVEEVEYNKAISININETRPFSPEYAQARYSYTIKFIR